MERYIVENKETVPHISWDETLVLREETLVSRDKTLVSRDKTLVLQEL